MKFKISNSTFSGNSKVLNNIRTDGNVDVELKHINVLDNAELLNNLDIKQIMSEVQKNLEESNVNDDEYAELKKMLKMNRQNDKKMRETILTHITSFSNGVLQNIIANLIMGKL